MDAVATAALACALIRPFEGLELVAYPDPASPMAKWLRAHRGATYPGPDSDGDPWTNGYGSTGPAVVRGVVWTLEQAEAALQTRVARIVQRVAGMVRVPVPDASLATLISLGWNIGCPPKACPFVDADGLDCCTCRLRTSSVLKKLNAGDMQGAAMAFDIWNKAGGVVNAGLVKRRAQEREAFLAGFKGAA